MKSIYKTAHHMMNNAVRWWETLSIEDRLEYRRQYEELRKKNLTARFPYPHMVDTSNSKITKLTGNQIYCICRFFGLYTKNK